MKWLQGGSTNAQFCSFNTAFMSCCSYCSYLLLSAAEVCPLPPSNPTKGFPKMFFFCLVSSCKPHPFCHNCISNHSPPQPHNSASWPKWELALLDGYIFHRVDELGRMTVQLHHCCSTSSALFEGVSMPLWLNQPREHTFVEQSDVTREQLATDSSCVQQVFEVKVN